MLEYLIHLIGVADDEPATILPTPANGLCHVSFRYRDRVIEAAALDYFEAFCQVRLRLEAEQLIPFCYGASMNVFPSGVCRDMGAGLKAYRLTPGKKPSQQNLVNIFDEGADVVPVHVAVQRQYYKDWLKSVGALPQ